MEFYNRLHDKLIGTGSVIEIGLRIRSAVKLPGISWSHVNQMCNTISDALSHDPVMSAIPWLVQEELNTAWPESLWEG
jgi:hypothetical protein